MHLDYHIPVPFLKPTAEEFAWAKEHIIPHCEEAANKMFEQYGPKFDKANVNQKIFEGWGTADRIRAHFAELGLEVRRFSVFVGAPGATFPTPHIDANHYDHMKGTGVPMIARLNVPLQGTRNSRLSWWNADVTDPRILERKFEEWDGTMQKMRFAFSYRTEPKGHWEAPVHVEHEPGPCWNHVELAHRLDIEEIPEMRINITTEILHPIPWQTLVERLQAKGYCHS